MSRVSPFEIPLIEQMLVRKNVDEVLKLCDLHVAFVVKGLISEVFG